RSRLSGPFNLPSLTLKRRRGPFPPACHSFTPRVTRSARDFRLTGSGNEIARQPVRTRRSTPRFSAFRQGDVAMTAQRWFAVPMLLALLLAGRVSNAQVLTGTLLGTVKDESGGVLPN